MKKRFVDAEIWLKEWYQELNIKEKLLVKYLFDNCNNAGMWNCNYRMASFIIGDTISKEDIENINKKNKLFIFIEDNKIFIPQFIEFQYGTLSEKFNPHKVVIEQLKKYDLYKYLLPTMVATNGSLQDKEQEQEQVKEQVQVQEKEVEKISEKISEKIPEKNENSENSTNVKEVPEFKSEVITSIDPYLNPIKDFYIREYKKVFKQTPVLLKKECLKLKEIAEYDSDVKEHIKIALRRLKKVDFKFQDSTFKPSSAWLLKDENFSKITMGEFGDKGISADIEATKEKEREEEKELQELKQLNPVLAQELQDLKMVENLNINVWEEGESSPKQYAFDIKDRIKVTYNYEKQRLEQKIRDYELYAFSTNPLKRGEKVYFKRMKLSLDEGKEPISRERERIQANLSNPSIFGRELE
jgi:hypothetical protein